MPAVSPAEVRAIIRTTLENRAHRLPRYRAMGPFEREHHIGVLAKQVDGLADLPAAELVDAIAARLVVFEEQLHFQDLCP
jgi:hypothetical protein